MPENRSFPVLMGFGLFVFLPAVAVTGIFAVSYNGLVDREEAVFAAWSQVESNYQRRADLVPNLVRAVQAYADHEAVVQTEAADSHARIAAALGDLQQAQAKAEKTGAEGKVIVNDEEKLKELSGAEQEVGQALMRVLALGESFPGLRANENFLQLQAQLEGTENRINVARMNFNAAAEDFNASIRRLPGSLLAKAGGFRRKAYFAADKAAAQAPAVKFNE